MFKNLEEARRAAADLYCGSDELLAYASDTREYVWADEAYACQGSCRRLFESEDSLDEDGLCDGCGEDADSEEAYEQGVRESWRASRL